MSDEEEGKFLRREIDRRMMDAITSSIALKEEMMNLRVDIRGMRAELKGEIAEMAHDYENQISLLRQEEQKNTAARNRMQVYILIIAFLAAQGVSHFADFFFKKF